MALSKTQEAFIAKLVATGAGELGVALNEETCAYLVAVIASDLGLLDKFPEIPKRPHPFFGKRPRGDLRLSGLDFIALFEKLVTLRQDADTYFYCLATLHKARLKYERILQAQPIPTIDQVGPRGLLQYGTLSPHGLAGFLFWRKWIFDIDNRAAQETGYMFEPVIAHALGGVPASAQKSPVKRRGRGLEGRQVDCIREIEKRAYEFKLRVTIAASGQGRWREELEFPYDCDSSGYTPVLIVFDPTPNPKLKELRQAFLEARGEAYIGQDAWKHLATTAGPTMATFLRKYIYQPLQTLLKETPDRMPDLLMQMKNDQLTVTIGNERFEVARESKESLESEAEQLPPDVDTHLPGP